MPRPRLQRAATARREKVQLRIREQSFSLFPRKEICRLTAGVQARRVPGRVLTGPKSSIRPTGGPRVVRQYPIKYACLRQYPVIEQDFRGRDAHGCVQHPGDTAHACSD